MLENSIGRCNSIANSNVGYWIAQQNYVNIAPPQPANNTVVWYQYTDNQCKGQGKSVTALFITSYWDSP